MQFPSKNRTPKINKLGKDLAEVFRTDFITAMKVPDSQPLPAGKMITLKDTWRQEWEKGVQVCCLLKTKKKNRILKFYIIFDKLSIQIINIHPISCV